MTKEQRNTIEKWVEAGVTPYIKGKGENIIAGFLNYASDAFDKMKFLLNALDEADIKIKEALKTCPNGGNDGYITPRPCQCEIESLEADRDKWKARAEALERVKAYWDSFYGQGLEIANWHMNGETELFDSFWESAESQISEPAP